MHFDLRFPLGMMFALAGAILTAFGLATDGNTVLYAISSGINVNLWWGLALLAFGLILLPFGRRGQKQMEKARGAALEKADQRRGR
jgi:hypothetical protein